MVTEAEAREMSAAIKKYQDADRQAAQVASHTRAAAAKGWFESLIQIVKNPSTRADALANYTAISALLGAETNGDRSGVLKKELRAANEVYKTVKKNGSQP
jgi:hypothetical protein